MIKVHRTEEAPRSLAGSIAEDRYRAPDVVEQLYADFAGKCYICEVRPVDDPVVEHRLPHKNGAFPHLKYDWANLFYCCTHCNTVKNKRKYDSGIIDCCVRDPEELLAQRMIENGVRVDAVDLEDAEAKLTADLIEEVFMAGSPKLREKAAAAKLDKLQMRMNMLFTKLQEYRSGHRDSLTEGTIIAMLRRDAAFAGFARCYVREHIEEYPEFAEYVA